MKTTNLTTQANQLRHPSRIRNALLLLTALLTFGGLTNAQAQDMQEQDMYSMDDTEILTQQELNAFIRWVPQELHVFLVARPDTGRVEIVRNNVRTAPECQVSMSTFAECRTRMRSIILGATQEGASPDSVYNRFNCPVGQSCRYDIPEVTMQGDYITTAGADGPNAANLPTLSINTGGGGGGGGGGSSSTTTLLAVAAIGGAIYWYKFKNPNANLHFAAVPTSHNAYHARITYAPKTKNYAITLDITEQNLFAYNPTTRPQTHLTTHLNWEYRF